MQDVSDVGDVGCTALKNLDVRLDGGSTWLQIEELAYVVVGCYVRWVERGIYLSSGRLGLPLPCDAVLVVPNLGLHHLWIASRLDSDRYLVD